MSPDARSIFKTSTYQSKSKGKMNAFLPRQNSPSKYRTNTHGNNSIKQQQSFFFHLPTQVVVRKVIAR